MWFSRKIYVIEKKARIPWLKEGDNNTRLYHNFANGKESRNLIFSLSIDGSFTEDPTLIKSALVNFYKSLYTKDSKEKLGLEVGTVKPILLS